MKSDHVSVKTTMDKPTPVQHRQSELGGSGEHLACLCCDVIVRQQRQA